MMKRNCYKITKPQNVLCEQFSRGEAQGAILPKHDLNADTSTARLRFIKSH